MQICVYRDAGPRRFAATHCITSWEGCLPYVKWGKHTFLGFLFICLLAYLLLFFFLFLFLV